jgi:hypothetical protein
MAKQYRILLTVNNKFTPWADLSFPFPAEAADGISNIQFSEELTVPETQQFWLDHRLPEA